MSKRSLWKPGRREPSRTCGSTVTPDRETIEVAFSNAEIQEALIGFCQSRHIPLAKRAEKKISLHGSSIALIVTVDLKQDKKPE